MGLHRRLGHHELTGDLRVREPAGHEPQRLLLTRGERLEPAAGGLVHGRRAVEEGLDHPARHRRSQQRLARVDGPDPRHEELGLDVLEQEPARTRVECLVDVLVHVEGREHDDARAALRVGHDPPGRLDAVDARHPHVHEDHVRSGVPHQGDRVLAVGGLADDREVRLDLEDHPEAGAHQRLVVDHRHPDGALCPCAGRHAGSKGRVATSSNPPSGLARATSEPPYTATRSRIPNRPCPGSVGGPPAAAWPSSRTASESRSAA